MKVLEEIESLIPKALTSAGPAIATFALEEAKSCCSFDDDLNYLKRSKIFLEDQLKCAEERYLQHIVRMSSTGCRKDYWPSISKLLTLMKSANYDIEDIITDSHHLQEQFGDASCIGKFSSFFSNYNPIITKVTLIARMKSVVKDLQNIQLDMHCMNTLPMSESSGSLYRNVNAEVIGRESDVSAIKDLMKQSVNEGISIIPILGHIGSGKSSIACQLYSDAALQKEFDQRIWISLSMGTVHIKSIAQQIISKVGNGLCESMELNNTLHHILNHQRCFVVLDGLWGEDLMITELKQMLQTGSDSRSKIIVTTHSEQIANIIATSGVYRLQTLSDEYCSRIFQSGLRCQNEYFEKYRDPVVTRCEGSPLVAKFLGSVVDSGRESLQIWESAKGTEIWKLEERIQGAVPVLQSFRQTYHNMPANLRKCFIYCSIFSLGSDLDKEKVARQWISLGFIRPAHSILPPEIVAEFFVQDIQDLFLFDVSEKFKTDALGNHGPRSKVLRMHTLAYNLARSVGREDVLVFSEDTDIARDTEYCNYRYGQLSISDLKSINHKRWPLKARALILKSNEADVKLLSKVISENRFLRVLDLRGCIIGELPSSIFQLKHLSYLDVSGLPISDIPLQRNCLEKLETLDLSETKVERLPSSISNLKMLSYLSLRSCHELVALTSCFGILSKLRYLDLSHCVGLSELPVSFMKLKISFLYLNGCQDSVILTGSSSNNLQVPSPELVARNSPVHPRTLLSESTRIAEHQLSSSTSPSASLSSSGVEHPVFDGNRTGWQYAEQFQGSQGQLVTEQDVSLSDPYQIHRFWTKRQNLTRL